MSGASYSLMLRNLSNDYYRQLISFDEYRIKRTLILKKFDEELNRIKRDPEISDDSGLSQE